MNDLVNNFVANSTPTISNALSQLLTTSAVIAALTLGVAATTNASDDDASVRAKLLVTKYCVQCHNADVQEGDIRIDQFSSADLDLCGLLYEQLSSRQMPPDDEDQPTAEERTWLANHFLAMAKNSAAPKTAALRRLNQREYRNTVRDLLGLNAGIFDPAKFVFKDEVSKGFDTDAKSLVTCNELLLEYLQAAQSSLQQALPTIAAKPPKPVSYTHLTLPTILLV